MWRYFAVRAWHGDPENWRYFIEPVHGISDWIVSQIMNHIHNEQRYPLFVSRHCSIWQPIIQKWYKCPYIGIRHHRATASQLIHFQFHPDGRQTQYQSSSSPQSPTVKPIPSLPIPLLSIPNVSLHSNRTLQTDRKHSAFIEFPSDFSLWLYA